MLVPNEVADEGRDDAPGIVLDIDLGQLPRFGGVAPDTELQAASWDATHVLVAIGRSWYLLPRDLAVGFGTGSTSRTQR